MRYLTFKYFGVYREFLKDSSFFNSGKYVDFHTHRFRTPIGAIIKYLVLMVQSPRRLEFRFYTPMPIIDYSKIEDVEIDGIHHWDAPDYCDAYISSATYKGREMSERELEVLNNDNDFIYNELMKQLY